MPNKTTLTTIGLVFAIQFAINNIDVLKPIKKALG